MAVGGLDYGRPRAVLHPQTFVAMQFRRCWAIRRPVDRFVPLRPMDNINWTIPHSGHGCHDCVKCRHVGLLFEAACQGRPKAPPVPQNASRKSSEGRGAKITKLWRTKMQPTSIFSSKKIFQVWYPPGHPLKGERGGWEGKGTASCLLAAAAGDLKIRSSILGYSWNDLQHESNLGYVFFSCWWRLFVRKYLETLGACNVFSCAAAGRQRFSPAAQAPNSRKPLASAVSAFCSWCAAYRYAVLEWQCDNDSRK